MIDQPEILRWGKKNIIYILVDPRDSRIYYVGQTVRPKARYQDHVHAASEGSQANARKAAWIADLKSNGLLPSFVILEVAEDSDTAGLKEQKWIMLLAKSGAPLTNKNNGQPRT